jgi:hypothetical protein
MQLHLSAEPLSIQQLWVVALKDVINTRPSISLRAALFFSVVGLHGVAKPFNPPTTSNFQGSIAFAIAGVSA